MKKLYFLLLFATVSAGSFAQNYTVLGSAGSGGSCNLFTLTPNSGGQAGAIFQNKTINLNNSFDFTFSNFFGCNGASGADGEAFVLTSNPNGLGNQGEGLGYGGSNQPCSFAVEFDTWQNGDHNDPSYDHTAFESGGSVDHNVAGPVAALASQSNLDNCQWHTIRLVWDVNTNTFSDYIDGVLRLSGVYPNFITQYFCGNPIVNWGWTGSTGGGWNLQQVRIVSTSNWVAANNYQSCSLTVPFTDISTANVGNVQSWNWTFGDGGTSTLQNPTHTYADTGVYNATLIITDVSGCADSFSHPVHIVAPIVLTGTPTNPLCNGAQTGQIAITETGGFGVSAGHGGFMYNWNNGNQQQTNMGLGAGTYTVTVTDGVCSASGQYTLNQPTALSASTSSTAASCGAANGTCTITISGGTPAYSGVNFAGVTATGGPNTFTTPQSFVGGTYIADFHDANGCSALLQYTATVATNPCGINSTTSQTNVSCYGGSNGSATLTVTGAAVAPPSTITWTRGGTNVGTGATINNLIAGTYTYSYSDANAANAFTGTIVITQPGSAIAPSLSTSNVSCAGMNNGQAIASVDSGGTAPFSYAWSASGQGNNPVASNLPPGAITVTITDANGCTATLTGTISSAPALQLNVTTTNNACNQFNNGSATANVTGGTRPYTYYWSNISSAQTDLSLSAGTFTVTVTDSASCTVTGSATITEAPPFVNTVDSTNIKCYGDSTGTITVNTSGGTTPYTYKWSSDTIGIINPNLTGANLTTLKAGEYLLTVTDAGGCIFMDSTFLAQPAAPLTVVTTQGNVTCYGANNGFIAVTLSGGTPPYTFNGQTVPPGTDTIKNLPAGTYPGTVTDANGCSYSTTVIITAPSADSIPVTQTNVLCNGFATGSATANFVNATGSVVYVWSNGQSGATISNLVANTYSVTGTDANGCTLTNSLLISQPTAIVLQVQQTNIDCFGNTNGSITINPSGGVGPNYTYTWNPNVSSTNTASNLPVGAYVITVTDQNACVKDTLVNITQPSQPLSATYVVTNVPCYNTNTGSINITTTGGTPTYTYTWSPNTASGNSPSNLAAGAYAVTITDLNGCTIDSSFTLTQPASALTATPGATSNLTCYQSGDGSATVNAAGGTTPYAYAWTGSSSTAATASSLAAGNYTVTVSDNNLCTASATFTLTQPAQILPGATSTNLTCNSVPTGTITYAPSGGAGSPYTYNWNPNVTVTNAATGLAAGTYVTTITDPNGCTVSNSIVITQPTAITLSPTTTEVSCFDSTDGTLTVNAANGTPPYSYLITDSVVTQTNGTGQFTNLPSSNYFIMVTDANSCRDSTTAVVAHPLPLEDNAISMPATCAYSNNAQFIIGASQGNGGYSYSVQGLGSNATGLYTNVQPGTYQYTVTDSKGCHLSDSVTVLPTDSIVVSVVPANGQVKLGDSLALTSVNNQPGNVVYSWTPTTGLSCYDCADPVFNGNNGEDYTVMVTNDSGCTATFNFKVTVIPDYDFFVPNAFTPNGDGKNDFWQIYGDLRTIKQLQVSVFDRWGEKVFESTDINFKWDGTYKGHPATLGVYVYSIKIVWLDNRSDDHVKGSLTVLQ